MKTIIHLIKKEFYQFRRDHKMVPMTFIAPILQLVLLGYAANLDVKNIPTLVCNLDQTPISRKFVSEFTNSGYFTVKYYVTKLDQIDSYIDSGKASIAIVIPRGFGNNITANQPAQLQVIVDGSETTSATIGLSYVSIIVSRYSRNIILQKFERLKYFGIKPARINPEIRVWYNPDLKSRNFMIPGILGLLLMVMTTILTSLAVVKEKEYGTLEQLIVTPIKPYQLILGKLAPFTLIGIIDVILVVSVAVFWFEVPLRGNVFLLFGLCIIFLMTTLGLGLFVSTVSKTQQQAMMTAFFFVLLPMFFLSGFVFPIENMPKIVQFITYFIPLRYFFVIIRGLFLKGVGLPELWDEAVLLTLFGVLILTLSVIRFQKKLG